VLRKKSGCLTREYNNFNNTIGIEKNNYIHYIKNWHNTQETKKCIDDNYQCIDLLRNHNKTDKIDDIEKYNSANKCNTSEKYYKNKINDRIENKIKHIAGSFIKIQNVPCDGDCGAHSLRICLLQHGIKKNYLGDN